MSDNFGLKIGLEGEREFKKSLAEINNSFKVLVYCPIENYNISG